MTSWCHRHFPHCCPKRVAARPEPLSLAGSWVMDSGYEIHAEGARTTNHGEHPNGLMMVDPAGPYSIQIFRPGRPSFASGVKVRK